LYEKKNYKLLTTDFHPYGTTIFFLIRNDFLSLRQSDLDWNLFIWNFILTRWIHFYSWMIPSFTINCRYEIIFEGHHIKKIAEWQVKKKVFIKWVSCHPRKKGYFSSFMFKTFVSSFNFFFFKSQGFLLPLVNFSSLDLKQHGLGI